ncbi:MAG: AI-2E family transporter [Beijerinckiaceae bacterium]
MDGADAPSPLRRSIEREAAREPISDLNFAKRVMITVGVVAIAYFLWLASDVLLLVFAAILVAILLRTLASALHAYARVGERWTLALATLLVAGLVGGFIYLFGAQLAGQLTQLGERLPDAIDAAGKRAGIDHATQKLEDAITAEAGSSILSRVTQWSVSLFGALASIALVFVSAVYLAADPGLYRRGFAMLFPPDQQDRVFGALDATHDVLRHWLAGQFVTMLLVGGASTLAYWMIGLPSAVALGVIAGVANFIPFLGPFLSAAPPLVFASSIGGEAVIWTLVAVVVIQQLEGNVVTPLVQRRAVSLPPALGVFAIVVSGVVFGIPGIFLAVPLAASLLVLVRNLWVRQTLRAEATAERAGKSVSASGAS